MPEYHSQYIAEYSHINPNAKAPAANVLGHPRRKKAKKSYHLDDNLMIVARTTSS